MSDLVQLLNAYAGARSDGFAKLAIDAADEIERLRDLVAKREDLCGDLTKQLFSANRKALEMRNAINDVELALAGLEIDDLVDVWDGAVGSLKLKVSLGALRQLRNSYPALNRIMNEVHPSAPPVRTSHSTGETLPNGDAAGGGADAVSSTGFCVWCDLEHRLHEDTQGFHHVIKGERVACFSGLRGQDE